MRRMRCGGFIYMGVIYFFYNWDRPVLITWLVKAISLFGGISAFVRWQLLLCFPMHNDSEQCA